MENKISNPEPKIILNDYGDFYTKLAIGSIITIGTIYLTSKIIYYTYITNQPTINKITSDLSNLITNLI